MTIIPEGMPSLAGGGHDEGDGEACVMEYVALIAGEEWSDHPRCTEATLANYARQVNDNMETDDRHVLIPFITRLVNTPGPAGLSAQMALTQRLENTAETYARSIAKMCTCAPSCNAMSMSTFTVEEYVVLLDLLIKTYHEFMGTEQSTFLTDEDLRAAAKLVNA